MGTLTIVGSITVLVAYLNSLDSVVSVGTYNTNSDIFFCSVKFNLVKQETSLHLLLLGILKRNLPTSLPTYPPSYSPACYKEKDNMNRNDDKNSFQVSREDVDIYQFSTTATTTS